MKKFGLLTLFVALGWGLYLAQPKLREFAGIKAVENQKPFVPPSSRILKAPRKPIAVLPDDESVTCTTLRSQLDQMDFNQDPDDWLSITTREAFEACDDSFYQERLAKVLKACASEKLEVESCQVAVMALRAQMRTRGILEPGNREEFMDFIFDEFSKANPDFKKLKNISRRFLDEAPDDSAMQKVWATSALISEGDPRNISEESKREIYEVIGPGQMENHPDLRSIDVLLKSGLEPGSVESMTRELSEKFPDDKANLEMLAWSLWQQGRRDEALGYLQRIPSEGDSWISELKKKLSKKDARKEDFPGRINIGLSFGDLTQ